jgi:hypothetical protein
MATGATPKSRVLIKENSRFRIILMPECTAFSFTTPLKTPRQTLPISLETLIYCGGELDQTSCVVTPVNTASARLPSNSSPTAQVGSNIDFVLPIPAI